MMSRRSIVDLVFNHITLLLIRHKFFLIDQRAFAGDHFKIFVEGGEIIKSAFITKLFNAQAAFNK